jgi:RNA polymerase sigma factor (sigma-70 family)
MRAWLERKARGGLEVDDIIQETFAILSALETVDEIRNPRSYAFRTAYSVVQRHLRRSRILSFQSFEDVDVTNITSEAPSPEVQVADRSALELVDTYLSELPRKCREVVMLRRVDGLSYRQIAERLDISENAVEKQLAKGAHLLMEAFGRGGVKVRQTSNEGEEFSATREVAENLSK